MEVRDGKNRTSKDGKNSNIGNLESQSRSLGGFPRSSAEYGNDQIGASRENSEQGNTVTTGKHSLEGIPGKIIDQLVDETEKQLVYYKEQVKSLEQRQKELKELSKEYKEEQPE